MTVLLYPRAIRTFIKNVLGGKNSDDDFEPRTDLNQPVGGLPGVNPQLSVESPLVGGPGFAAGDIGGQVRIFVQNAR
jgi:hypothetical protein